jgi:rod shape-determining protein MreC
MTPLFKRSSVFGRHWLFFVVVSALLIFFDHRGTDFTNQVRVFLSIPLESIRVLTSTPFTWSHQFIQNVSSHQNLLEENEQLRQKEALLSLRLEKWKALVRENKQLHVLLNTAPQIDGKVSGATVIAINIQSGNQTLILNKGRSEGVFVGQPVLDSNGLIGQVIRADWYSSVVLLITDLKSAVPVEVARTGEQGILVGTGSISFLKLNNLSKTTQLKKGDKLLTSGLGGHFPGGYPVGKIKSIKNISTNIFAQIIVSPVTNIEVNRPVFLLWPNPKPHSFIEPISL